jgi:hypothetical protein
MYRIIKQGTIIQPVVDELKMIIPEATGHRNMPKF